MGIDILRLISLDVKNPIWYRSIMSSEMIFRLEKPRNKSKKEIEVNSFILVWLTFLSRSVCFIRWNRLNYAWKWCIFFSVSWMTILGWFFFHKILTDTKFHRHKTPVTSHRIELHKYAMDHIHTLHTMKQLRLKLANHLFSYRHTLDSLWTVVTVYAEATLARPPREDSCLAGYSKGEPRWDEFVAGLEILAAREKLILDILVLESRWLAAEK